MSKFRTLKITEGELKRLPFNTKSSQILQQRQEQELQPPQTESERTINIPERQPFGSNLQRIREQVDNLMPAQGPQQPTATTEGQLKLPTPTQKPQPQAQVSTTPVESELKPVKEKEEKESLIKRMESKAVGVAFDYLMDETTALNRVYKRLTGHNIPTQATREAPESFFRLGAHTPYGEERARERGIHQAENPLPGMTIPTAVSDSLTSAGRGFGNVLYERIMKASHGIKGEEWEGEKLFSPSTEEQHRKGRRQEVVADMKGVEKASQKTQEFIGGIVPAFLPGGVVTLSTMRAGQAIDGALQEESPTKRALTYGTATGLGTYLLFGLGKGKTQDFTGSAFKDGVNFAAGLFKQSGKTAGKGTVLYGVDNLLQRYVLEKEDKKLEAREALYSGIRAGLTSLIIGGVTGTPKYIKGVRDARAVNVKVEEAIRKNITPETEKTLNKAERLQGRERTEFIESQIKGMNKTINTLEVFRDGIAKGDVAKTKEIARVISGSEGKPVYYKRLFGAEKGLTDLIADIKVAKIILEKMKGIQPAHHIPSESNHYSEFTKLLTDSFSNSVSVDMPSTAGKVVPPTPPVEGELTKPTKPTVKDLMGKKQPFDLPKVEGELTKPKQPQVPEQTQQQVQPTEEAKQPEQPKPTLPAKQEGELVKPQDITPQATPQATKPSQNTLLKPSEKLYHGTNVDFKSFDADRTGGLISLSDDLNIATQYAQGAGGMRARKGESELYVVHDANIYEKRDDSKWHLVGQEGEGQTITPTDKRVTMSDTEIQDLLKRQEASTTPREFYTHEVFLKDGINILDLTKKQGVNVLSTLDGRGNKYAEAIIEDAKDGNFFWSRTKEEARTKTWQNIINPQLEQEGYSGIHFADDIHKTVAVFSPDSITTQKSTKHEYKMASVAQKQDTGNPSLPQAEVEGEATPEKQLEIKPEAKSKTKQTPEIEQKVDDAIDTGIEDIAKPFKPAKFKKEQINVKKMKDGAEHDELVDVETYKGLAVYGKDIIHVDSGLPVAVGTVKGGKPKLKEFAQRIADAVDMTAKKETIKDLFNTPEFRSFYDDTIAFINDKTAKGTNRDIWKETLNNLIPDEASVNKLIDRLDFKNPNARVHGFDLRQRTQLVTEALQQIGEGKAKIKVDVVDNGIVELNPEPGPLSKIFSSLRINLKDDEKAPVYNPKKKTPTPKETKPTQKKEATPTKETQPQPNIEDKPKTMARRPDRIIKATPKEDPSQLIGRQEIQNLVTEFFDVPVRQGKFRQHALGIFKTGPKVIRLKKTKDLEVLFHEVGHMFSDKLNLDGRSYSGELMGLGKKTSKPSYTDSEVREEGVAEFFRHFLSKPDMAKQLAPKFYEYVQDKISKDKNVVDFIKLTQGSVKAYTESDPVSGVMSNVAMKRVKGRMTLTDIKNKAYDMIVNEMAPLQRMVDAITKGEKLAKSKDPTILEKLYKGKRTGLPQTYIEYGVVDKFGKKTSKGLTEILEPVKEKFPEFVAYALSKHANDVEKLGINTGIDKVHIDGTLARYKDDAVFNQAQQELVKFQNHVLQSLVESGLLEQKSVDAMRERYPNYVPLNRVMAQGEGRLSKSTLEPKQPLHKLKGSERDVKNPIDSIITNTYTILDMAERNKVMQSVADLSKIEGAGQFIEKIPPDMIAKTFNVKEIKNTIKDIFAETEVDIDNIDLDMMASVWRPITPKGDINVISVYRNGKPEYYQIGDNDVYKALTNLTSNESSLIVKLLSYPARTLRAGALYNLNFPLSNVARDQFDAAIFSTVGFVPFVDSFKGAFDSAKRTELYYKWLSSGAAMSDIQSIDRARVQNSADDFLKSALRRYSGFLNPVKSLSKATQTAEEGTRIGLFKRGLDKTKRGNYDDHVGAAEISRTTGLDYQTRGSAMRSIARTVPFSNPVIQGMDRNYRVLVKGSVSKDPEEIRRAWKTMVKLLAYVTVPTMIEYLLNRNNPEYDDLQQWEKDSRWHFFYGSEPGNYMRYPKPHSYSSFFSNLPRRILEYIDKEDPTALDGMTDMFANDFGIHPHPGKTVMRYMPQAMLPLVEVMFNKSYFFDRDIIPRHEDSLEPYLQYGDSTSEVARRVGKWTNISPRQIDHVMYGYGGGLTKEFLNVIDKAIEVAGEDDAVIFPERFKEIPVARVFSGDVYARNYTGTHQSFWEELNTLESKYNSAKRKEEIEDIHQFEDAQKLRDYRIVAQYLRDKSELMREMRDRKATKKEQAQEVIKTVNFIREFRGDPLIPTEVGKDVYAAEYKVKLILSRVKNVKRDEERLMQDSLFLLLGIDREIIRSMEKEAKTFAYEEILEIVESNYEKHQKGDISLKKLSDEFSKIERGLSGLNNLEGRIGKELLERTLGKRR